MDLKKLSLHLQSANLLLENLRKLDRKSKIKWGSMGAGGILLLVLFAWPAWMVRPQITQQIKGLRSNLTLAESKIKLEPKMKEEQQQCDLYIQEAEKRFLTESESQSLIGILTELGEKAGVTLLSTQPQTDVPAIPDPFKEKYIPVSYLLAAEGGFHAFAAFISDIENHAKILRVEEFSVTPREEKPTTLVGEIRLTAFLLKDVKRVINVK